MHPHSLPSLTLLSLSLCCHSLSACLLSVLSFLFKWSTSEVGMHSAAHCLCTYQLKQHASAVGVAHGLLCCEIELKTKGELLGTFASVKHIMHHHYEARQREQGIARVTESTVSCFPPLFLPPLIQWNCINELCGLHSTLTEFQ